MHETFELMPGVTLRCIRDRRFKQGCLSLQLLRPMCQEEAALNALIPAVLLRGCENYPDLKRITERLDELYGASVGTLVRRIGDYQTTGLYCGFMEDRFAFAQDKVLEPMIDFVRQLLLCPIIQDGGFSREFVESEKRNLISVIESERSDKRAYAASQLLKQMCGNDSFGVPRLGQIDQVERIEPLAAYAHYQKLLRESPVELFYVGSAEPEQVAQLLRPLFAVLQRRVQPLPPQSALKTGCGSCKIEAQEITQAKLAMGFVTEVDSRHEGFAAMQVLHMIFGGGMTSKLFMQVREKMSLCYAIGSAYYSSKGILTVHAGIDTACKDACREAILAQLEECRRGKISQQELTSAKESILSGLRAVYDSPGAMENYFSTMAISGTQRTPETYRSQVEAVDLNAVVAAAKSLQLHSEFFLKGGRQDG